MSDQEKMEHKVFDVAEYHFKHPCSVIISGVSLSGKTTFTKKLLDNIDLMFSPKPERIIISYAENSSQYLDLNKECEVVKGLDFSTENYENIPTICVVDDQMQESGRSEKIQELFTRGVHHRNMSLIYITQNLFSQGKFSRDMRLNAHYFVIFKSPTFLSQIMYFGRQTFPERPKFLTTAYKYACSKPFSYIFVNLHPECPDELRVRSGILPRENQVIYSPR